MLTSFLILVVDDDPLLKDILDRAAQNNFPEASFIQVNRFEEAKKYIEELEGKVPKIVLLDVDLHDRVDGLDFLALIRVHPKGRALPVVVLSANDTPQLVERSYTFGASSFTLKPFSFEDWKQYLSRLRMYWFETVTLPDVRHTM
ncbi:response regulator [Spirosoma aerophilum]